MAAGFFYAAQKTTPLMQAIQVAPGVYPSRSQSGDGVAGSDAYIGLVRTFASFYAPGDALLAQGQSVSLQTDEYLYAVIGGTYSSGDSHSTFELPNLSGIVEIGASSATVIGKTTGSDTIQVTGAQFPSHLGGTGQLVAIGQPALAVNYAICISGQTPTPHSYTSDAFVGEVVAFLGNFAPEGFALADGSALSVAEYPALYNVIQDTYGSNGSTTFDLPNLQGRDIVGAGSVPLGTAFGHTEIRLSNGELPASDGGSGSPIGVQSPGLALNYIICTQGTFPMRDGPSALGAAPYLGEVRAFAGPAADIPEGWVLAMGQTLPINAYQALFALLGTEYGGNGTSTFALPDLNDSVVSGTGLRDGTDYVDGQTYGSNEATLTVTDASPCYCRGTHILTDDGEIAVESLAIGQRVMTACGVPEPIRWIGRRSYAGAFIAGNHLMLPVCVKAGALGEAMPRRDLWVSPGHALFIEGQLVPAWRLINGVSIVQACRVESATYYHVELARHAVILAEGAPAESFLDDGCRQQFQNADEFRRRYPDVAAASPLQCRLEDGFGLQAMQERIAARAGARTAVEPIGRLRGFVDRVVGGRVSGWAQDADSPEEPVALEISVGGAPAICVLANAYRADLRRAGLGSGCHAFDSALPAELAGAVTIRRVADGALLAAAAPADDAPLSRAA